MTIHKAIGIGVAGNEISKQIAGTSVVSVGRTAVATAAGGACGAVAGGVGAIGVGCAAFGVVAAPVVIPLAVASAAVSFIASLFDW